MKLIDYITKASPEKVIEAYIESYGDDKWANVQTFEKFVLAMSFITATGDPDALSITVEAYSDSDSMAWVDGLDQDGRRWALDFIPWSQLKNMEVIENDKYGVDEMAAHIYNELTFHGWPKEQDKRLTRLMQSINQLQEGGV